jgi:hypothetical protein
MSGLVSLLEAAAKFAAFETNLHLAGEALLFDWAATVQKRAKELIGSYKNPAWPQLAESTQADRERQGFPADEPLLRTGELRDSIGAFVEMHGAGGRAVVGSNDPVAEWQELGTSRIPPRSFLLAAALDSEKEIARMARKYVHMAWVSAGRDNELLHLLHALKIAIEIAHEIYSRTIGKHI